MMANALGTSSAAAVHKCSTRRHKLNFPPATNLILIGIAFGALSFTLSEGLHLFLVPELGRRVERLGAEGISAVLLGIVAASLFAVGRKHRAATLARMQVISDMNHHIRNALEVISISAYTTHDERALRLITDAVQRIEWTLREILPRETALGSADHDHLLLGTLWNCKHR